MPVEIFLSSWVVLSARTSSSFCVSSTDVSLRADAPASVRTTLTRRRTGPASAGTATSPSEANRFSASERVDPDTPRCEASFDGDIATDRSRCARIAASREDNLFGFDRFR
jgi:hypothetical protein